MERQEESPRSETIWLSVVVPAFNEAAGIESSLEAIVSHLKKGNRAYEIVVVDDGSTDGTSSIVAALGQRYSSLRLLRNETNQGKGSAVKRGVLSSRGEYVLFSDADLSTPIEEAEKVLVELDNGADVAIGSRALPHSRVELRQGLVRETMGKTFNVLVRRLLGLPFTDTQCGFKAFTRPAARDLFSRLTLDGFAFDVGLLCLAQQAGCQIREVPVRWRNRPETKVRLLKHSTRMLIDLLRLMWSQPGWKRPREGP